MERLSIKNAIYHPDIGVNLISVRQLANKGAEFLFRWNSAFGAKGDHIFMTATESNELYIVNQPGSSVNISGLMALHAYSLSDPDLTAWHDRLGHLSEKNIEKLSTMSNGIRPLPDHYMCPHCVQGRQKEKPHRGILKKGTYPLESLHLDEAGMPSGVKGVNNTIGWLAIVCDYTEMAWVELLTGPKDWFSALKEFLQRNERPERRCHMITIDKLGTHISEEFKEYCRFRGIDVRYTGTGQHESNGVVESYIGHLKDTVRTTLRAASDAGVPLMYWPIVMQPGAFIRNRSPHLAIGKTPYEAWYGDKPDLDGMVTVGTKGWCKLPKKVSILEPKAVPCIMLGYSGDNLSYYVVLRTDNHKVTHTNNVNWRAPTAQYYDACKRYRSSTPDSDPVKRRRVDDTADPRVLPLTSKLPTRSTGPPSRSVTENPRERHLGFELPLAPPTETYPDSTHLDAARSDSAHPDAAYPDENVGDTIEVAIPYRADPATAVDEPRLEPPVTDEIYRGSAPRDPPGGYNLRPRTQTPALRYGMYANPFLLPASPQFHLALAMINTLMLASAATEPRNLQQAKKDLQWYKWKGAMNQEYGCLVDNNTWTLCELPVGHKALSGKWVYKLKRVADGQVMRYKARWVVRAFNRLKGWTIRTRSPQWSSL